MSREPARRRYGRFFGADPNRDIDEELAFHLAMRVDEMVAMGASTDDARAAADDRFGNFDSVRTEMETLARRRSSRGRRASIFGVIRQDITFALRTFASNPAYAAAIVLTMAIGIAANSLVFSVAYGVLIQPFPYRDADRIVRLWSRNTARNLAQFSVSPADYKDWSAQSKAFSALGAYERQREATLIAGGEPIAVPTATATPEVFALLGTQPINGRMIQPQDVQGGRAPIAVISSELWHARFGSDAAIVGKRITLDGKPLTVVGVMPPRFALPANNADIWTPLDLSQDTQDHGNRYLRVLGRLAPGATIDGARAELNTIAARISRDNPGSSTGWDLFMMTVPENIIGTQFRKSVLLLGGVVGFVLLIGCANAANLQLARGAARRRELAVRTALGASRSRVVAQLTVESLILALVGGVIGVALAQWALLALRASAAGLVPRLDDVRIGIPVLAETFGIVLLATLLAGLLPAGRLSRTDVAESLKSSGSSPVAVRGGDRLRSGLVIAEMALSIVLLVGAGLLMRSFVRLQSIDLGFRSPNIQLLTIRAIVGDTNMQRVAARYEDIAAQLRALPGVSEVSAVSVAPFNGVNAGTGFVRVDRPLGDREMAPGADYRNVLPGYFSTLGISVKRGREFQSSDRVGAAPAVIISDAMARKFWPGEDPIGKQIRAGNTRSGTIFTIVGVVDNARYMQIEEPEVRPMMYFSALAYPPGSLTLTIRASEPAAIYGGVRRILASVLPGQPIPTMVALDDAVAAATASRRFALMLFTIFAGVALLLAAIGIYGVMTYMVRQRTHEIGIRLALGASRSSILGSVMSRTLRLSAVGITIGLGAAWMLSSLLKSLLFGVEHTDWVTYLGIAATLALVASIASLLPARRAMRADPVNALRGS